MIRIKLLSMFLVLFVAGVQLGVYAQASQSPERAESRELNAKVIKLYAEGKFDEAIPLAKRALALREKADGPDHEDLIPLLTNLAELYRAKQEWKQARAYVERLLTLTEKKFGANDLHTAQILHTLGYLTFEQRNTSDAERFFARALEIKEKIYAVDDVGLTGTMYNLAEIYRVRHDYARADTLYERLVRIHEKSPGKKGTDLIRVLDAYWANLTEMKQTARAEEVRRRLSEVLAANGIVEGGVLNGTARRLVQPPYPAEARRAYSSGQVRVRVTIDENGKVISANAINPGSLHPSLVRASEEAARQSLFTPTLVSGVPVQVTGIIIYNFVAQ